MPAETDPTDFLGGIGKLMSLAGATGGNGKSNHFLVKALVIAVLIGISFFIGATRDWIGVTKEGAVSAERIEQVEKNFASHIVLAEQQRGEFVRKDVIEPRLTDITRRLDRIEQLLLDEKRKR